MVKSQSWPKGTPPLEIATEKVCYIVIKAREFDAKDTATIPDPGSNAADDMMYSVLEDRSDDPVLEELTSVIQNLDEDEQIDLVALAWLGRGDGTLADWAELRRSAAEAHNERTADYVLGLALLSDYLEEGLNQFGRSCEGVELGRM